MIEGFEYTWIGNKLVEVRLAKVVFKNQSLEPLNPRILGPFLPTNWEKILFYKFAP